MYRNDAYWNKVRGWGLLGLLALPFLLCGLGLLFQTVTEWGVWLALQTWGAQTEATITRCRKDVDDDTTYLVMYDYAAAGDTYVRDGREEVSAAWYATCHEATTITVRYLSWSPSVVRIEGNTYRRNSLTVIGCWIHILTLTLGVLLLVARKAPDTLPARRWAATLFNGGGAATVVTLIGWLIELAVVGATNERQGIVALTIGLLIGALVALLTWLPGRRENADDINDTYSIGGEQ
ncbi:MAG: DUF3592 domain-containing protein [Anaerolineae bacterium]|nr:DUF3592 domain-containing protein [Anaerolineae bacterium]